MACGLGDECPAECSKMGVHMLFRDIHLGDGPHWDEDKQCLYFVEMVVKRIHRYDYRRELHTMAILETDICPAFIVPVAGTSDKFILGTGQQLFVITWDGVSGTVGDMELMELEHTFTFFERFTDGKCDSKGRLWAGTIGHNASKKTYLMNGGNVYRLERRNFSQELENLTLPSGIVWSLDYSKLFLVESEEKILYVFDYDIERGTISNKRIQFTFDDHEITGTPDGMTIDEEGNLWVAIFNQSAIIRVASVNRETLLNKIEVPAVQVTSLVWGGPNLDELFLTTGRLESRGPLDPETNGVLMRLTNLGTKGLPMNKFKL